jgi:Y-box-binding protein 1
MTVGDVDLLTQQPPSSYPTKFYEDLKADNLPKPEKKVISTNCTGIVKWFNVKNGYGFIHCNDTNEDIFVHQSAIVKNNPNKYKKSLGQDEKVVFDIVQGEKGNEAISVTGPDGEPVVGSEYARDKKRGGTGYGGRRSTRYRRTTRRPRKNTGGSVSDGNGSPNESVNSQQQSGDDQQEMPRPKPYRRRRYPRRNNNRNVQNQSVDSNLSRRSDDADLSQQQQPTQRRSYKPRGVQQRRPTRPSRSQEDQDMSSSYKYKQHDQSLDAREIINYRTKNQSPLYRQRVEDDNRPDQRNYRTRIYRPNNNNNNNNNRGYRGSDNHQDSYRSTSGQRDSYKPRGGPTGYRRPQPQQQQQQQSSYRYRDEQQQPQQGGYRQRDERQTSYRQRDEQQQGGFRPRNNNGPQQRQRQNSGGYRR